jgi:hypothetical protein
MKYSEPVILENEGQGYQNILTIDKVTLPVIDVAKYKDDPVGLQAFIQALVNKPFDLSSDRMMRADLLKLDRE